MLFQAANPAGTSPLALEEEIRAIDAKIRGAEHRDRLTMVSHWAVRLDDLAGLLMRQRPEIVHFSGHGAASGAIVLVGADGTPKTVPPEALAGMFRVLKDNVRVVVLNACYSGAQAKAIVKEIDCAIGMSAPIGDDHAIAFAAEFYQALGFEKSVQQAYDLGVVRLLGEGVADAKTLVKLHKRRGVNPAQIVLVGTQPEPQTPGEPARPADQKTPTPAARINEDEIREVLRPLMGDREKRQARLGRAFAAYPGLLTRIGVDGDTGVFLSLLLQTLRDYGEVEPGTPAVRVLLESIKGEVGAGDRARIDAIISSLQKMKTGTDANP
ncbi:MAG: CHAT domain-containing protein [Acidimicrobiia bacterium]|nr:CHAT domain-containing protein [Acidimicrobiia bacterium]